jgi:MFS family permease
LLIGVGVSVCLAGAFKALAQHFPVARLPLLNGLVMAAGGLGGAVVGTPLNWLLTFTAWRTVCMGLAAFTLLSAAAIWTGAPAAAASSKHETVGSQFRAMAGIFRQRLFWKTALFASLSQAVFYTMQSLWVGAFLRDVSRLSPGAAASLVSVLAFAMMAGCVGFGSFARMLERRGLSVRGFCGLGMVLFVVVQVLIMAQVPLPASMLWSAYGFFGGTGILAYAVMTETFPANLVGRVNTSLNLVLFIMVFGFQVGVGAVLSLWAPVAGHYPVVAHLCAWGVLVVLQLLSAAWYFMPARARTAPASSAA